MNDPLAFTVLQQTWVSVILCKCKQYSFDVSSALCDTRFSNSCKIMASNAVYDDKALFRIIIYLRPHSWILLPYFKIVCTQKDKIDASNPFFKTGISKFHLNGIGHLQSLYLLSGRTSCRKYQNR